MTTKEYVFKSELVVTAKDKLQAKRLAEKQNGWLGKHYLSVYPPTCKKIPSSKKYA
jgi:hypothetical protein